MTERQAIFNLMVFHRYIEPSEQKYELSQLEKAIGMAIEEENTEFLRKIPIHFPMNLILYDALKLAAEKGKLKAYKELVGKKSTDFWRKGASAVTSRNDLDRNYVRHAVINERCNIVDYALNDLGVFVRAHSRCAHYINDIAKIPFIRFQESNFQCEKANASLRKLLLPYLPQRLREKFGCPDSTTKYLRPTDSDYGFSYAQDKTLCQALSALNQFQ